MSKIFVSYKSANRPIVEKIAASLRDASHDVWLDQWRITGREPYWDEIERGIKESDYFIFAISPAAIDKDPTNGARKELFFVSGLKKPPIIIPIMVEATAFDELPINISPGAYQIHDFVRRTYDEAVKSVLWALDNTVIPIVDPNPVLNRTTKPLVNTRKTKRAKIFINYRRADTGDIVNSLSSAIEERIGEVTSDMVIPGGADWLGFVHRAIEKSDVLLVLIGTNWLNASYQDGHRRLDEPNDFIRQEIETALHYNLPVIPVLVNDAQFPAPDELPESIKTLAYRNPFNLTTADFQNGVTVLLSALARMLDAQRKAKRKVSK